jgi:hypothetical protein
MLAAHELTALRSGRVLTGHRQSCHPSLLSRRNRPRSACTMSGLPWVLGGRSKEGPPLEHLPLMGRRSKGGSLR